MAAQEHLWEYYTRVALQRGVQAVAQLGPEDHVRRGLPARVPAGRRRASRDRHVGSRSATSRAPTRRRSPRWPRSASPPCTRRRAARACCSRACARSIRARKSAGTAVTVFAHPGDNWMLHVAVELLPPGDIARGRPHRRTTPTACSANCSRRRSARAACAASSSTPAAATCASCREMDFPVWSRAVSAKGTVKATRRRRSTCRSSAPAQLVHAGRRHRRPTTTASSSCRARRRRRLRSPAAPGSQGRGQPEASRRRRTGPRPVRHARQARAEGANLCRRPGRLPTRWTARPAVRKRRHHPAFFNEDDNASYGAATKAAARRRNGATNMRATKERAACRGRRNTTYC